MVKIVGGEGDDNITGTANSDFILGRGGQDNLHGLGGDDIIDGNDGASLIYGDAGNDQIATARGPATIYGGANSDLISVGFYDTASLLKVFGEDGDDIIITSIRELLDGSEISGGSGLDRIIIGGAGGLPYAEAYVRPIVEDFYQLISGIEVWHLTGYYSLLDYNKVAFSTTAPQGILVGGIGSTGSDDIDSYPTHINDTPFWEILINITDNNFRDVNGNTITFYAGGYEGGGQSVRVDGSAVTAGSLVFREPNSLYTDTSINWSYALNHTGGGAADAMYGGREDDQFQGNGGNDYFDGGDGLDVFVLSGPAGNYSVTEILYNTFVVRDLIGGDGEDTIVDVNILRFSDGDVPIVIAGMDIVGDDTDDELNGSEAADRIAGGGGNDTLNGKGGHDILLGGKGADTLYSEDGNDVVDGGSGNDLIIGGSGKGNDVLKGADGSDTVKYTSAKSGITVDLGASTARGSAVGDAAEIGSDTLESIENVIGGNHDDVIIGNDGANDLEGAAGADTLSGGGSSDSLRGGSGGDRFEFSAVLSASNIDRIRDMETGRDKIVLDLSIFTSLREGGLKKSVLFADKGAKKAKDSKDRIVYDEKTGKLYYDQDGKGGQKAVHFATLDGSPDDLSHKDFVVVA